jgi:hypothetical protein
MSSRILKWLTSMEAREGVGQKMEQLVTRMSMSLGRRPEGEVRVGVKVEGKSKGCEKGRQGSTA